MQSLTLPRTESLLAPATESGAGGALRFPALRRIQEIECLVEAVVASWHVSTPLLQSRRWHRLRYEKPVVMAPVDDVTGETTGELKLATVRDISLGGMSFTHTDPISHRNVALTFVLDDGVFASVETRLTWCRFTLDGVYQSGGLFLRTVALPFDECEDWSQLRHA